MDKQFQEDFGFFCFCHLSALKFFKKYSFGLLRIYETLTKLFFSFAVLSGMWDLVL